MTEFGQTSDSASSPGSFDEFELALRDALLHLRDPEFAPSGILYPVLGCSSQEGPGSVQTALIAALESFTLASDVPPDNRVVQGLRSVQRRYLLGLTQEEIADVMHVSVRSVHRMQREATYVLAQHLWQRRPRSAELSEAGVQASDWRSQTDLELAALRAEEPNAMTGVKEVIDGVLELATVLATAHGVSLNPRPIAVDLTAATHPAVLRQTIITAVKQLAPHITSKQIDIYAQMEDGVVRITLTGAVDEQRDIPGHDLVNSLIVPTGASVEIQRRRTRVFLQISLPSAGERVVLVIEDNPDMVHFYRRCTAGTTYRIVHTPARPDL
ncbi:MAG: hypothetical protein GX620_15695, partial [Chloroflexi bacterium]|nr:hypothetical protein [Chloroflexota bacterium]